MTDRTTPPDWAPRLVEQLSWHWDDQLRPGLDGLTDAVTTVNREAIHHGAEVLLLRDLHRHAATAR